MQKADAGAGGDSIKANVAIALGDLAFRFPNLLEPWTPHIYASLQVCLLLPFRKVITPSWQDPNTKIRRYMLMVLTHLILNDMVKVKGDISELARLLEDKDERIRELTKLCFHELAQKGESIGGLHSEVYTFPVIGAVVYNIIPNIISRLSSLNEKDGDTGEALSSESFRNIMKYLLSFIQKACRTSKHSQYVNASFQEKQSESLIEKLCHRLHSIKGPSTSSLVMHANHSPYLYFAEGATGQQKQCRDIVYCMTLLTYNDKIIKKLNTDLLKCFLPLVGDEEIYASFQQIVAKESGPAGTLVPNSPCDRRGSLQSQN